MTTRTLSSHNTLWTGLCLSVSFRIFTYSLLWFSGSFFASRSFPFPHASVLFAAYGVVALAAPFLVPLVAGFIGSFYWRDLSFQSYTPPIFVVNAVLLTSLCLVNGSPLFYITGYPLASEVIVDLALYGLVDGTLCMCGVARGREFWNGHLARQLVGDFSTHYEDQNIPTLH